MVRTSSGWGRGEGRSGRSDPDCGGARAGPGGARAGRAGRPAWVPGRGAAAWRAPGCGRGPGPAGAGSGAEAAARVVRGPGPCRCAWGGCRLPPDPGWARRVDIVSTERDRASASGESKSGLAGGGRPRGSRGSGRGEGPSVCRHLLGQAPARGPLLLRPQCSVLCRLGGHGVARFCHSLRCCGTQDRGAGFVCRGSWRGSPRDLGRGRAGAHRREVSVRADGRQPTFGGALRFAESSGFLWGCVCVCV